MQENTIKQVDKSKQFYKYSKKTKQLKKTNKTVQGQKMQIEAKKTTQA